MISFIIPTIYRSERLISLLRSLDVHSLVSEILLIEDCPYTGMLDGYNFNKLTIIPFQERKFCNGGWNLGVSLSKNYYYALCSDDILFPTSVIDDVIHFYKLRPKSGVIGMHPTQYNVFSDKPLVYGFVEREVWHMDGGWGALQFNHKDNLILIPEDLKHWCGDTYNVYYSKYPCYNYFGEKFYTGNKDHGTSTNEEVLEICLNDQRVFEEKYKLEKPIWKK
jgi:GT2 family glycosyltransferase